MTKPEYQADMFPHWTSIAVRFRDLDPLNHVNNAIFSTYFEEARVRFIHQVPELMEHMERGFSFVLANVSIDYVKPVEYPATLLVGSGIRKRGNTSITTFQAIYTEEAKELAAVATVAGVWYDVEKKRPAPLPQLSGTKELMLDPKLFTR